MKDNIYEFVKEYVSYYETAKKYKLSVEKVIECGKFKWMMEEIRLNDAESYIVILRLEDDGVLYEYLKIMLKYYENRQLLRISMQKVAELTKVPIVTIRRFENLKHIASFKLICNLAKAVNLKLKWE